MSDFYILTEGNIDEFILESDTDDSGFEMWQGLVGPYYIPYVDESGNLSWTNTGNLPNPATVNIIGPQGRGLIIGGIVEDVSDLPALGEDGVVWLVGSASPYEGWLYINDAWDDIGELSVGPQGPQGPQGIQGPQGLQGLQGPAGQDGTDGATPDFSIGTVSTLPAGSSATASITGTDEEPVLNLGIPVGQTGANGQGVPASGSKDQILKKSSATDYDTEWTSNYQTKLLKITVSISAASTASDIGSVSNAAITSDMEVIKSSITNKVYQTSAWTVTITDGSLTVNGTASAATTLTLILGEV